MTSLDYMEKTTMPFANHLVFPDNARRLAAPFLTMISFMIGTGAYAQDADAGRAVFHRCAICHSAEQGENRIGPSLFGVVGRKAASLPDFPYSTAMQNAGLTWTPDVLDHFLTNPQAAVPGTRMSFPGLSDPKDRANLIAYLTTLQDSQ